MPIPKPRKGENKGNYVSRTIGFLVDEGYEQNEAAAIAYQQWDNKGKKKVKKAVIPMDWSIYDITSAVGDALRKLYPSGKDMESWMDVIDIYIDGEVIFGIHKDGETKYYKSNWTFNSNEEVEISNQVEVQREWEEVDKLADATEDTIVKKDIVKQIVYGVVLKPEAEDAQGDIISEEEIEKAAHAFLTNYRKQQSDMGIMHTETTPDVVVVESYIAPSTFTIGKVKVKKGSWIVGSKINKKELWDKVQKGQYAGYSIGGRGKRVESN